MAIFTDMAPSWAKAVATVAAARKRMNMGDPFGVGGGDKKKRPGSQGSEGAAVGWIIR